MFSASFWDILSSTLPIFFGVFLGSVFRKKDILAPHADSSLTQLLIHWLMPCLILDAILKNRALERLDNLFLSPLVGFFSILLGLAVAYFIAQKVSFESSSEKRTFIACTAVYNYGYLPLPLIIQFYDMETAGVLFVHNIGVEIALWSIVLMVMRGSSSLNNLKKIINPPLVAILMALFLNYSDLDEWLPQFIYKTFHLFGQAAIPVAILVVGATIYDHIRPLTPHKSALSVVLGGLCARVLILPVLFLCVGYLLPCSLDLKRVIALQAAMPAGLLTIIMARQYGGVPSMAFKVIVSTSLVSLITLPLWIQIGHAMLQRG